MRFDNFSPLASLAPLLMASKLSAPVNNATFHAITKQDPHIKIKPAEPASQFSLEGSYGTATFPGVLPDNGYLRIFNSRPTSDIRTGTDNVRPRSQCHESPHAADSYHLPRHANKCTLPVLSSRYGFDGDQNRQTENVMKQRDLRVPVIHKWGHPLMLLQQEQSVAQCIPLRLSLADYIAVSATRQLPAFFAFSTGLGMRLTRAFSTIANVCEHCQLHAGQPKRFRFTLRNDHESNHEVLVWIIYLDGNGPVLHVVDSVTGFNAARFLKVLSAQHTWDALRMCWIVVYQGSHDFIPTDAGIDFRSRVFKRAARTLAIIVKAVPIEAHHDIGKVERYHATLRRAYDIICAEDHSISRERFLQMTVKTINDTAGPNGLISTLLVFSAPSPGVAKRAEAVQKTTDELRRTNLAVYTPTAKSLMPSPSATARTVGVKSTLVVNFASDVDDDVVAAFFSAHGVLLTNKDCADLKLATQLQKSGKITTPGRPFEQSDKVAVKGLIDQDILGMVMYDPVEHANVRISQSRMVEMKGKNTNEPHEKSRLVIQVYLDNGKERSSAGGYLKLRPRLLISSTVNPDFAIIGVQIDHALGFTDANFPAIEDQALTKASFAARVKQQLAFNPGRRQEAIRRAKRARRVYGIDLPARGIYNLSTVAQHLDPSPDNVKMLNARLRWQMASLTRGLTFVPVDLPTAKLFVCVDGLLANDADLTSQLGCHYAGQRCPLRRERVHDQRQHRVYFRSKKSKRATRSLLTSEIYGMVAGVDAAYTIFTTL
ncbi:hypothetical protein CI238_10722 [Colletotrichum incanum]|uniref:Integrase catalytic domain-containing protein n=1 Tax=Colletotrichum incanum TaxID=1573173 RepID=A0A167CKI3_COLIC|nr:hypothetical protein CI238_10722 [Colletotrichum incanum]